jgi:hypothetical protein
MAFLKRLCREISFMHDNHKPGAKTGVKNYGTNSGYEVKRPERPAIGRTIDSASVNQSFFLSGHCYHPTGILCRIFFRCEKIRRD